MKYQVGYTYRRDGMKWTITLRIGDVIMVQVAGGGHWEVMRVRRHSKDRIINGLAVSRAGDEYLPSDAQFGSHGWAFNNFSHAFSKFGQVVEHAEKSLKNTERTEEAAK